MFLRKSARCKRVYTFFRAKLKWSEKRCYLCVVELSSRVVDLCQIHPSRSRISTYRLVCKRRHQPPLLQALRYQKPVSIHLHHKIITHFSILYINNANISHKRMSCWWANKNRLVLILDLKAQSRIVLNLLNWKIHCAIHIKQQKRLK